MTPPSLHRLERRPEARAYSVQALLELVSDGRIRVPSFQRPLKWKADDVVALFDSIYRGFPVGELLLSKAPAPAQTLVLGPVHVDAPAHQDALHVVDGQQRLTSLAGSLLHPDNAPRRGEFAIWFDLEEEQFVRAESQELAEHWIPLNVVADSFKLLQWLNEWPYREQRKDLVRKAIGLGQAIREYPFPAYVVEGASEEHLRLIFKRINTAGVQLEESEVFDALFEDSTEKPIKAACARLETETRFGAIDPELFLRSLKVVEGIRPSVDLADTSQSLDGSRAVLRTEVALRQTLEFLIADAGIIHGQLLPYRLPLIVLTRFFDRIPQPHSRSRELLARWVWRGILTQDHSASSNAVIQKLASMVDPRDESESVQALLATVRRPSTLPDSRTAWNGRAAMTRACALAFLSVRPRDPGTGDELGTSNIQAALDDWDLARVFLDIPSSWGLGAGKALSRRGLFLNPMNALALQGGDAETLASHFLDDTCLRALEAKDVRTFERRRAELLDPALRGFFQRMAGLKESDRPRIGDILRDVDTALAGLAP